MLLETFTASHSGALARRPCLSPVTPEPSSTISTRKLVTGHAADVQPHQESLPKHLLGCPDFDCAGDCRFFRWVLTLAPAEAFPGAKALQFLIVVVVLIQLVQ